MNGKNELSETEIEFQTACQEFVNEWPHFCEQVNWKIGHMDRRSVRFFNVVPSLIEQALKASKEVT